MIAAVEGLVAELRLVGIPVSASEYVDALSALRFVDLGDRTAVKTALGAAIVKDAQHESAYSAVFDLYFAGSTLDAAGGAVLDSADDDALTGLLLTALAANEPGLLRALAAAVVTRYAGIQPGRSVAGTYYLFRALRAVAPDSLPERLLAAAAPDGGHDRLTEMLLTEEYERRVAEFKREVEAEIRRRLVADRGAADVARTLRKPLPEDADFLTASAAQIAELRDIVAPMARKLAAKLAQRQRHRRRGPLDFRRTVRSFRERFGYQLRSRSTVLVLGDARANYHASGAEALKEVGRRAGHLFWLNPEPSAAWDSGDSVMREYTPFCDSVFECRNLRQLRAFIEQLV